MEKDQWTT